MATSKNARRSLCVSCKAEIEKMKKREAEANRCIRLLEDAVGKLHALTLVITPMSETGRVVKLAQIGDALTEVRNRMGELP